MATSSITFNKPALDFIRSLVSIDFDMISVILVITILFRGEVNGLQVNTLKAISLVLNSVKEPGKLLCLKAKLPTMKKIFFSFLLILFATGVYSQKQKSEPISLKKLAGDTIIWKQDSLLKIEDFKFKGNKGPVIEGLACTGVLLYPKEKNAMLDFYVEAIFIKSKSYMKENSAYTLKHEQLHFDITELYARKLRQKLLQTDFKKVSNIVAVIQGDYNRINQELEREQEKYDDDTQHGMNPAKQQVWEDDIKKQLDDLDNYRSTEINVANNNVAK